MTFRKSLLSLTLSTLALSAAAEDYQSVEEMVITGVGTDQPLILETDPKAPRQPLPAQDGADYLKTIPGFSVIRKGGTSGDPVLRGMAGSRLSLLLDGDLVLGGCGNRMDPPTAYVFPETYDRIRLIKGPQTVLYGPGNSAGVVLFERNHQRLTEPDWSFHGSLLAGSFGRDDQVVDVRGGTPDFYLRGMASHSQEDNYKDGDGAEIHSQYDRWNTGLSLGWTPGDKTTLELNGNLSDAEAAYADRGMDGSKFARENLSLKWIQQELTPWWSKLEAQVYYNSVDHVMDNYRLRQAADMGRDMGMNMGMEMMAMNMATNQDRETKGGRILAYLSPTSAMELVLGLDTQTNAHSNRSTSNQMTMPYQQMARVADADFEQLGVFGEWTQKLAQQQRVIAGIRFDDWSATDLRTTLPTGSMAMPNPTAGLKRDETLTSGFLRYEKDLLPLTFYAGLGRSQRFPDYWELISREAIDSLGAFDVDPETHTQWDIGALYSRHQLKASVSAFYNQIDDYLLIQSGFAKRNGATTRTTSVTRNVDATTLGMEADVKYRFNHNWRAEASLASVRGSNDTDGTYLAQLPPIEWRLGVYYENPNWSAGVLWRAVDDQKRVDPGKGNIAGQDIGPSAGFNVFSVNLGWRAHKNLLVTAGMDNLLDKTYAEHISKSGAMIAGYEQLQRINEPGRTLWLKMQLQFE